MFLLGGVIRWLPCVCLRAQQRNQLFVCLFLKVVSRIRRRYTKLTRLKEMSLLKLGSIAFKNLKAIKEGGE